MATEKQPERKKGKARIRIGATITHDFAVFQWPSCKAPGRKHVAEDPHMVFNVEWNGRWWDCRAPGYGEQSWEADPGDYGNGSVFAFGADSVVFVDEDYSPRRQALDEIAHRLNILAQGVSDTSIRQNLHQLSAELHAFPIVNERSFGTGKTVLPV